MGSWRQKLLACKREVEMKGRLQAIPGMSLIVQVAACGSASTPEDNAETTEAQTATTQEIDWNAVETAIGTLRLHAGGRRLSVRHAAH
jgi:hypothetical protein